VSSYTYSYGLLVFGSGISFFFFQSPSFPPTRILCILTGSGLLFEVHG
jgi:hypothetical protein